MKNKGIRFICLLFSIFIILFFIRKLSYNYKNKRKYNEEFIKKLGYGYILFYSITAGLLVYIGLEDFKDLLNYFISDKSLACLISVTILITFCFIYAAFFKDIMENIFSKRVQINEWDNVKGYVLGRIIVIIILYFIINNLKKKL